MSYGDPEGYESVDIYPDSDVEEWDTPPTIETILPPSSVVLPGIHSAIYDPTQSVEAVEAMLVSDPLSLSAIEEQSGYTPLHAAVRACNIGLIKMLVQHGAVLEAVALNGETPLIVACQSGSLYVVHTLCECGADPRAVDKDGQSLLHHAAKNGAVHILHYLSTTQGLDFRATDNEGNTPLHCAVYNVKMDTISYLLRHKRSDLAAANKNGTTPVHLAAKHGNIEMSWVLLHKALSRRKNPLTMKDTSGLTPLDIAKKGHSENHQLLAKRLTTWSVSPDYMRLFPWGFWMLFSILGGVTLLLAMLAFAKLFQPVGFVVAVFIAVPGFFLPLSLHRIPHPSGWPNPLMVGGLVAGVGVTTLTYFIKVFPVLWPANAFSFVLLAINAFTALVLFFKLRGSDPGFDNVGKLGKDGKPLTILDVAKQADTSSHSLSYLEGSKGQGSNGGNLLFCTSCEIVIPEYTKHCKLCDGCCRGFDHHCMWLTRCIGYNNHRMFLMFLFCLAVDNSFFVYHGMCLMANVSNSASLWDMLSVGFSDEAAVMFLVLVNLVAAVFAFLNLGSQLLYISRMETTYFDMTGQESYRQKRHRPTLSVLTRLKLVYLFFTDYPLWYSRRPANTYYPKYLV